jgi:hypothetical protein
MAKASVKSTPAPAPIGKIIDGGAIQCKSQSDLILRNPVVAERGEFTKSAAKSNHKRHLEKAQDELRKAQDAAELEDYLDELTAAANSVPNVAPPVVLKPDPPRRAKGAPNKIASIIAKAKDMIETGEVTPVPGELTEFCDGLSRWWEKVRGDRKTVALGTIINAMRPIWKAALNAKK